MAASSDTSQWSREVPRDEEAFSFFRDKLGSPRNVLAPMVCTLEKGVILIFKVEGSTLPFRILCRRYGVTLAYTPMLHRHFIAVWHFLVLQSQFLERPNIQKEIFCYMQG